MTQHNYAEALKALNAIALSCEPSNETMTTIRTIRHALKLAAIDSDRLPRNAELEKTVKGLMQNTASQKQTFDALAKKYAELEAEKQWRPIESAPKDGTVFDVWTKYGRVTNCVRCKQWGRIYSYCNESADYNNLIMDEATHWMPLPTPPKEQTR